MISSDQVSLLLLYHLTTSSAYLSYHRRVILQYNYIRKRRNISKSITFKIYQFAKNIFTNNSLMETNKKGCPWPLCS